MNIEGSLTPKRTASGPNAAFQIHSLTPQGRDAVARRVSCRNSKPAVDGLDFPRFQGKILSIVTSWLLHVEMADKRRIWSIRVKHPTFLGEEEPGSP